MIQLPPIPDGRWAVGVSGGADSVALLLLLAERSSAARLYVVHLDHETRGAESAGDAAFVADLAGRLGIACTVERRSEAERRLGGEWPPNVSARFRAVRLALFREVCRQQGLAGVALAHHADDQAETVLQRLLRGSGPTGLAGMAGATEVGGLRVLRPLLGVRRVELREYMAARGQTWREDASNASEKYMRNRLRGVLRVRPELTGPLLELGDAMARLRSWTRAATPVLGDEFRVEELHALPGILAREAARVWLISRGVPAYELEPPVIERLLRLAGDAASAASVNLPTGVTARRRNGVIIIEPRRAT